jgi:XRE family transcriptional regulator, regulator of sulfur utilization
MGHPADIGANVRRRRLALGLTLEQLAEASGVSPAMLSEVERSVKNPTVKLAYQVARALGCSLTDLLEDDSAEAPVVVRAADRRTLVDPETGVERHGLSPDLLRRGLELVWYALPPGASAGEMAANRRGIVEHLVVIQGALTVLLGGEPTRLARGDGMTYRPQTTVEYRNAGRAPCAFILLSDSTRAD